MVLGKLTAALTNRIDAAHFLRATIEDEVARLGLAVGLDREKDQAADRGIPNLRVVQRLVRVVDGLGIDALASLGVVLDLDRKVAVDRLDEEFIQY